jgi:hypothetical protein
MEAIGDQRLERQKPLADGSWITGKNSLADLKISRSESHQFRPSQAASNQQFQNRPITFASEAV